MSTSLTNLTIKDFILGRAPCFVCKNKIEVYLSGNPKLMRSYRKLNYNDGKFDPFYIKSPESNSKKHSINVASKSPTMVSLYENNFVNISNVKAAECLFTSNCFLFVECSKCKWKVNTENLRYNFESQYIFPFSIDLEEISLKDNRGTYYLLSSFVGKTAILNFKDINNNNSFNKELPYFSIFSIKDQNQILKKIKTIMNFS